MIESLEIFYQNFLFQSKLIEIGISIQFTCLAHIAKLRVHEIRGFKEFIMRIYHLNSIKITKTTVLRFKYLLWDLTSIILLQWPRVTDQSSFCWTKVKFVNQGKVQLPQGKKLAQVKIHGSSAHRTANVQLSMQD